MTFQELSIIEPILKALKSKAYFEPTPIQYESIPVLLKGKDILGSAQTGTGKTAAFAIPILQHLYNKKDDHSGKRTIKALVLAPTRELALQINENFIAYGKFLDIRSAVIFGGVPQAKQVKTLNNGVDILVATPGRLLDLINQKKLTLKEVSYLVLDEADKMLDMGFVKDVKKIVAMVKKERQTMFFSATIPKEIMVFANTILTNPVRIKVSPEEETVDKIKQSIYYVDKKKKINLLVKLLRNKSLESVLVFSRTKHGANRIVKQLSESKIIAEAIHGNKSQRARQRALNLFKAKKIRVLVATDIAARGIDVDELSHVINYDLPEMAETYIHRIGRTGRAGHGGFALSLCSQDEVDLLKAIQKHIKSQIRVVKDDEFSIDLSMQAKKPSKPSNNKKKSSNYGKKSHPYNRGRKRNPKAKPFSRHNTKSK